MDRLKNILPNLDYLLVLSILCSALVLCFRAGYYYFYGIPTMFIELDFKSFGFVSVILILSIIITGNLPLLIALFGKNQFISTKIIATVIFLVIGVISYFFKEYLLVYLIGCLIILSLVSFIKFNLKQHSRKISILFFLFIYLIAVSTGLGWVTAKTEEYQYVIDEKGIFTFVILGNYKDNYIVAPIKLDKNNSYEYEEKYSLIKMSNDKKEDNLIIRKEKIKIRIK
ncbi:hypothetical protein [Pseudoneobacillus rhizosphaerae]|uniref:Uncharacterized protein n=1 Tax=Pseudoneobacillus rhizosphaerae TaxID=2880968 RepID=A0A9C7LB73_9BACI|nr:hypothetical protein [Pseudoneobacillus rhizosphaerae]CAG9609137.1 hypothetical protein NEOCIP111885_02878 [Pseudoneobacillus rhizosphaerae]